MTHTSLSSWLSYIESQHPSEIELGLERGSEVLRLLNLSRPNKKVITVAGTNGKGSTCAMLTQYLCSFGHSVGTYTSPHFLHFNERVALNNVPCSDALLCQAFEVIEQVRGETPLTYFEFSTLAALWVFDQSDLDYWVLEVGLGGRLDSVNMIDTDVAVMTSIALDHTDWLGDNLEVIAQEKAGIARKDKLLISGVVNPPASIQTTAADIGALLRQKGKDFNFTLTDQTWCWEAGDVRYENLPMPGLPLQNAATVVAVLVYMGFEPDESALRVLFNTAQLTGRFQKVQDSPDVYIDVAHNPEAAQELVQRIAQLPSAPIAVCGMLKDKDINRVMSCLADQFSAWFCADLSGPRGAKAEALAIAIASQKEGDRSNIHTCHSVADAFDKAIDQAELEKRPVIVFGSFVTVSDYLALNQDKE
ncbi:bifunctional tetrahydrofolate synthase/dihydrofolate synthase [Marinomonas algarum]|uniref:Dihydrofolate synthase/folylpolyglutamate synthase n=1 Tax=Marinomonas algarum TaxID=2883105 RepID=A0A9X1IJE9_9GAMM|nr:bifunctional tetrahydrofolate synthase/dihydrofolate synthase [Marinomonas algarum]MCB5160413.1 bifunctional tetrahydrofolate synthase/dihydrofolate synthase [Marinomonas algarum]